MGRVASPRARRLASINQGMGKKEGVMHALGCGMEWISTYHLTFTFSRTLGGREPYAIFELSVGSTYVYDKMPCQSPARCRQK
jgi:hypothetical protein